VAIGGAEVSESFGLIFFGIEESLYLAVLQKIIIAAAHGLTSHVNSTGNGQYRPNSLQYVQQHIHLLHSNYCVHMADDDLSGGSRGNWKDFTKVIVCLLHSGISRGRSAKLLTMSFPVTRLRRMRQSEPLRALVRETRLTPANFIYPLFVCPGEGIRKEISSMPGVFNISVDEAVKEAREAKSLGLGGLILFGLPESKDETGTGAWAEDGIIQRATRAIKKEVRDVVVIGDVCLCEYTSHGHCGIVAKKSAEYEILNDPTLDLLAQMAVAQARAGMDIVAPSDMMDGRVAAIRKALDQAGFANTPILSYAAKFASGFYGPFREAADSAPQFGDRRSYQMDGPNLREAMREIQLDIEEGADMIMVKPAMPYLDVIAEAHRRFDVPLSAYQVSGEYSMLQAAIHNGWLDRDRVILESLTSIRRAGAQMILTYFAKDAARLLG
jgi:porphobilinogen synthase